MAKRNRDEVKTFRFRGLNRRGRHVKGEIKEKSIALARLHLEKQGVKIKRIYESKEVFSFNSRIKSSDITNLARQLAAMIKAGINIINALSLVAETTDKKQMRVLLLSMKADVESGKSFTEALQKHPKYFDNLFCSLVEAGERSGSFELMLDRIATHKEKSELLKKKIKKASKYPIAVIVVAILVTAVMLIKVIPVFENLFASFNAPLPKLTQIVVNLSDLLINHGVLLLVGIVLTVLFIRYTFKTSKTFRDSIDRTLLKLPIFGNLVYMGIIARFSRTLATTFNSGLPLTDALDAAGKSTNNVVYEEAVMDIRTDVMGGQTLNFSMRNSTIFPPMAIQMVSIGEEAGDMSAMLDKVAEHYESEVDNAVDGLTTILEPLIMCVLAVIVGGLVIAMYLPIMSMGDAF